MKILTGLLGVILMLTTTSTASDFSWPKGQKAAVCLTYDDAWTSQLDIVLPALDKLGFKATFYIEGKAENLNKRMDEWRVAAVNGHEIGNHTLFHPCLEYRGQEHRDWLTDEYKMENYTLQQFVEECRVANVLLKAIDGQSERSFAYTCCDTWVDNNISLLEPLQALFPAARSIGSTPTSIKDVHIMDVPSFAVLNHTGEELIQQVKLAQEHGTFVVFLFHGVDESHLPVSSAAHLQLLDYLTQQNQTIWTDTFLKVMKHLVAEKARLGWK